MANFNQIADSPVTGGDLPFTNFGVTDIPANLGVLLDPNNDYGIVLPSSGGGVAGSIGVTREIIKAGTTGKVRVYGTSVMKANGTITRGNEVQISDTASKLGWAKAKGAGIAGCGVALISAADTDPVLVLLSHAANA
jgi:hypothetical protein